MTKYYCLTRGNLFSMKPAAGYSIRWMSAVAGMLLLFLANSVLGQPENNKGTRYKIKADSLLYKREYKAAAMAYVKEHDHHTMAPFRKQALVNAARGYAAVNMQDSALNLLELAVRKYGFSDRQLLLTDSIFLRMKPSFLRHPSGKTRSGENQRPYSELCLPIILFKQLHPLQGLLINF